MAVKAAIPTQAPHRCRVGCDLEGKRENIYVSLRKVLRSFGIRKFHCRFEKASK